MIDTQVIIALLVRLLRYRVLQALGALLKVFKLRHVLDRALLVWGDDFCATCSTFTHLIASRLLGPGYYCPVGSTSFTALACPNGYNDCEEFT